MTSQLTLEEAVAQIEIMQPVEQESTVGHGEFVGLPLSATWSLDGRSCTLLAPISYTSESGTGWPVPTGAWLDGASIPQPFWSIIGGPYEGKYREASVVHDHYCITKDRPWRDTHRMFHDAMLCRGVPGFKARIMFYAVYRFGPRWADIAEAAGFKPEEFAGNAVADSVLADAVFLQDHAAGVAEIERLADQN